MAWLPRWRLRTGASGRRHHEGGGNRPVNVPPIEGHWSCCIVAGHGGGCASAIGNLRRSRAGARSRPRRHERPQRLVQQWERRTLALFPPRLRHDVVTWQLPSVVARSRKLSPDAHIVSTGRPKSVRGRASTRFGATRVWQNVASACDSTPRALDAGGLCCYLT